MKKLRFLIIPIFCILMGITIAAGCDNNAAHIVIFSSAGGSGLSTTRVAVKGNDNIDFPNDPTKTGYTFAGWYEEDYENKIEADYFKHNSGVSTLYAYAKWQANTYTVAFDYQEADGGNSVVSNHVTYDSTYTLPTPTRTGYIFSGWYTRENGLGTLIIDSTKASISKDHILYAYWVKDSEVVIAAANYSNRDSLEYDGEEISSEYEFSIETCGVKLNFRFKPAYYTISGTKYYADNYGYFDIGEGYFIKRSGEEDLYYTNNGIGYVQVTKPDGLDPDYTEEELVTDAVKSEEEIKYSGDVLTANDDGYFQLTDDIYYKRVDDEDKYYNKDGDNYTEISVEEEISDNLAYTPLTMVSPVKEDVGYYIEGSNYKFRITLYPHIVKKTVESDNDSKEEPQVESYVYINTLDYVVYDEELFSNDEWQSYNAIGQTLYSTITTINSSRRLSYGDVISSIDALSDTDYVTFVGWYSLGANGKEYINKQSTFDTDTTLYLEARFVPKTFTISFSTVSSSSVVTSPSTRIFAPKTYSVGDKVVIAELPVPTRSSYTFIGWTTNGDWANDPENVEILDKDFYIYSDCKLYPVWQEASEYMTYLYTQQDGTFVKYADSDSDKFLLLTQTGDDTYTFSYNNHSYVFTYDSEDAANASVAEGEKVVKTSNSRQLVFKMEGETFVFNGERMIVAPHRQGYDFEYWVENPYSVSAVAYRFLDTSRDVILYAYFNASRYTVVFNKNEDSEDDPYAEIRVSYERGVASTYNGVKAEGNKKLYRWYYINKEDKKVEVTTQTVAQVLADINETSSINLYPVWIDQTEKLNISYRVDGIEVFKSQVSLGGTVGTVPAAKKSGTYFLGWYYVVDGDEYRLLGTDVWTSDLSWRDIATYDAETESYTMVVNAKFLSRLYSVVIRYNNSSVLSSYEWLPYAVPTGSVITLPDLDSFDIDHEGYDIISYNTKADGTGTKYKGGDKFEVLTTTNLYLIWQPKESRIYYLDSDGSLLESMEEKYVKFGEKIGSFSYIRDITSSERGFAGWSVREEGALSDTNILISENYTFKKYQESYNLYATWDDIYYYVRFMTYDVVDDEEVLVSLGSNYTTRVVADTSTVLQKPTRIPTRDGYVFAGWVDVNGDEFVFGNPIDEDTYVYSSWLAVTDVAMSYGVEGADVTIPKLQLVEGSKVGTLPVPTREGYTLDGWYTQIGGQGQKITADTIWDNNATVLYAYWRQVDNTNTFFKIRLFVEGEMSYGSYISRTVTLPQAPSKAGFAFAGWYTAAEGGELFDFDNTMINSDINLYARFA